MVLDKNISRRVTNNFKSVKNYTGSEAEQFKRWRTIMQEENAVVAYDRRNNIYCIAPTFDFEMYANYINYLNENYDQWLSYGYLDMGMVPYLMWPSFMNTTPDAVEYFRDVASKAGANMISVPSVSFLKMSYASTGTDYWVFREDMIKIMEYLESVNPNIRYPDKSIENATLSNFLKPLVEFSRAVRGDV